MKKIISLFCLLLASSAAVADVCEKVPGHWSGMFLLKDEKQCQQNNGCAHYVSADVSLLHAMYYELHFQTPLSKEDKGVFLCEDGKISSPLYSGKVAYLQCHHSGDCVVSFEDENILMQLRQRSQTA